MKNNNAFTLTELLVALGIIGAIAALSIPSLLNSINNRILATQLKGITQSIQQLASDKLVIGKTKKLSDTDFASPETLFTTKNFDIASKCANPAKDCWKTTATDKTKVTYRIIDTKSAAEIAGPGYTSIQLTSGTVIGYKPLDQTYNGEKVIGEFCLDVNGTDSPNMSGRDYFCMQITDTGKIIDMYDVIDPDSGAVTKADASTTADKITKCKGGAGANYCFGAVVDNGWIMPY